MAGARLVLAFTLLALACVAPPLGAQSHGSLPATVAAPEAAQYDFLVGEWELEVRPKVSGLAAALHGAPTLHGAWRAWRAFDGFGIEDELRVFDGSGNPHALNHTLRVWSAAERRWQVTTLDVYRARVTSATAEWRGDHMLQSGRGADAEGKPLLSRTRFEGIGADTFRMVQDRSTDGGSTWDEGALVIEARRVAHEATR